MHHTLNVIHSNTLTQRHIQVGESGVSERRFLTYLDQPYDSDTDLGSNEDMMEIHVPQAMDDSDGQAYQDDISIQPEHHITYAVPASHAVLPSTFSPQKHRPYAALEPLERTIMKYMCHHRDHSVLIADLAQAIRALCGCTGLQFK